MSLSEVFETFITDLSGESAIKFVLHPVSILGKAMAVKPLIEEVVVYSAGAIIAHAGLLGVNRITGGTSNATATKELYDKAKAEVTTNWNIFCGGLINKAAKAILGKRLSSSSFVTASLKSVGRALTFDIAKFTSACSDMFIKELPKAVMKLIDPMLMTIISKGIPTKALGPAGMVIPSLSLAVACSFGATALNWLKGLFKDDISRATVIITGVASFATLYFGGATILLLPPLLIVGAGIISARYASLAVAKTNKKEMAASDTNIPSNVLVLLADKPKIVQPTPTIIEDKALLFMAKKGMFNCTPILEHKTNNSNNRKFRV
ncbi:MAG: hypothetical protein ABSA84_06775 [Gammaproteobacteria bacterium]|jgi:hypothetical protein